MTKIAIIITIVLLLAIFVKPGSSSDKQTGGAAPPTVYVINPEDSNKTVKTLKHSSNDARVVTIDKITQVLKNQQEMLKLALGKSNTPKPQPTKAASCATKKPEPAYRDWARAGTVTQSSQYGSNPASNAIDGNPNTFSHTDISPNSNSWLTVLLPVPVEINKIVIENRPDTPGSLTLRQRLPPFTITVKNPSGIEVASKTFNDILQTYVWNDVFAVGSLVTIQQQKKNYLHIADIKIFGMKAQNCAYYEKHVALHRERISPIFQQLKTSACLLPQPALMLEDIQKAQAVKFNETIKQQTELQKAKTVQAKKIWTKIQNQQALERQMAAQAKRLGLPPPTPMYTKEQVELVKKNLEPAELDLSDKQKAECLQITNQIKDLNNRIQAYQKMFGPSASINIIRPLASQVAELQKKYNQTCLPPAKPDLTSSTILDPTELPMSDPEPEDGS